MSCIFIAPFSTIFLIVLSGMSVSALFIASTITSFGMSSFLENSIAVLSTSWSDIFFLSINSVKSFLSSTGSRLFCIICIIFSTVSFIGFSSPFSFFSIYNFSISFAFSFILLSTCSFSALSAVLFLFIKFFILSVIFTLSPYFP